MASEQQSRRENVTDERKIEVEKDRVPKMTTHFESLAEKTRGDQPLHGETRVHHHETTVPVRVGGLEDKSRATGREGKEAHESEKKGSQMHTGTEEKQQQQRGGGEEGHHRRQEEMHGSGERREKPSLEEISNLRGTAQESSMEAIRAAEERYHKAKESTGHEGIQTGGGQYAAEKGGAVKDTAMEKGQHAKDYTAQKSAEAKDVISSQGGGLKDTAVEKGQQAKDFTAQKAMDAKDVLSSKGQTAAQYASEKAKAAKDTAVNTTMTAAGYVGEKAGAAKDATVEGGKGAAGYAGKVAAGVKDTAVVAGWGAAHYTLEKVAEATKAVAGVTSSVAGYTGEKAAAAGHTVAGFAGEKLVAAKDVVVASEEKMAEYAARKKVEAQRGVEEKKSAQEKDEGQGTFITREEQHETRGQGEQHETRGQGETQVEKIKETFQGEGEESQQTTQQHGGAEEGKGADGGSVIQAIGETIVEIGQTTKDLLVGPYPAEVMEHKGGTEVKDREEPYSGEGKGAGI